MDIQVDATTRIESNTKGQLTLGVASQLGGAVPKDFADFLDELQRVESKALILLGPTPYPEVGGMNTIGVGVEGQLDLVHGRTGRISKLFTACDLALASSAKRRRCATALARPHLEDPTPPIILVGGTRVGGSRAQIVEHVGGAWVVQVGVFNPLEGADRITQIIRAGHKLDPSYGGTILRIDLNDHDCPVTPTFRDYSW